MIKIFALLIFSVPAFCASVLLAKSQNVIISTQELKHDHVGAKVYFVGLNGTKIVARGVIKKIIKEEVKSLVHVEKGQTGVGDLVFMTPEEAFDWIKTGGKSELSEFIPNFLKSSDEEDEVDEDTDVEYAEDDEVGEEKSPDAKVAKNRNIFLEGHAGLGSNADGMFYRFGGTASYHPHESIYYLGIFDFSIVNFDLASMNMGGGVSTFAQAATYNTIQAGAGLGYSFNSFALEGVMGFQYSVSDYSLTTNTSATVDYGAETTGLFYGARVVYKKHISWFQIVMMGGFNLSSTTTTATTVFNATTSENQGSTSDREYYVNLGVGFGF